MTEDQALWGRIGAAIARFVYRKNEFVQTGGSASAHKPILLDAGGHIDASMLDQGDIDHTQIANRGTNTHAQIDSHIAAAAAHGATGAVVGTTNSQTLTNKTLDAPVITGGAFFGSGSGLIVAAGDGGAVASGATIFRITRTGATHAVQVRVMLTEFIAGAADVAAQGYVDATIFLSSGVASGNTFASATTYHAQQNRKLVCVPDTANGWWDFKVQDNANADVAVGAQHRIAVWAQCSRGASIGIVFYP